MGGFNGLFHFLSIALHNTGVAMNNQIFKNQYVFERMIVRIINLLVGIESLSISSLTAQRIMMIP